MARTNHGGEKGFSIIELMIVMSIIGILIAVAIFTYLSAADRMKLQGDARGLSGTLQLARMRAISTGMGHGVAFWRSNDAFKPDAYFVFVDCDANMAYSDDDTIPWNNKAIASWDQCASVGYDPILKGEKFKPLSLGDYFTSIFGSTKASPSMHGGALEYVIFNSLGQAMWGTNLADGDIFLQNRLGKNGTVDKSGIRVYGASGANDLIPMSRGEAP